MSMTLRQRLRSAYRRVTSPHSKHSFLCQLGPQPEILDVGCGSNAPFITKSVTPSCIYTGIDVSDYNHTKPNLADHYILTSPEAFADEIGKFKRRFDAVISSHNIEHCNDRDQTLAAMLGALKAGGQLFMSFPYAGSVEFPKRQGCLNYFDDPTHVGMPPDFDRIVRTISNSGFTVEFAAPQHRPPIDWLSGWINESMSAQQGKVLKGTWGYYGFESIIWARRAA